LSVQYSFGVRVQLLGCVEASDLLYELVTKRRRAVALQGLDLNSQLDDYLIVEFRSSTEGEKK
jgi:hypothetical protein